VALAKQTGEFGQTIGLFPGDKISGRSDCCLGLCATPRALLLPLSWIFCCFRCFFDLTRASVRETPLNDAGPDTSVYCASENRNNCVFAFLRFSHHAPSPCPDFNHASTSDTRQPILRTPILTGSEKLTSVTQSADRPFRIARSVESVPACGRPAGPASVFVVQPQPTFLQFVNVQSITVRSVKGLGAGDRIDLLLIDLHLKKLSKSNNVIIQAS
jgi:hypothetical protein